ncbi:MAG: flagellar biosynthetic protein FliO [Rhizobiales bacterium]|nr:flagellar biosynthetic protein FliO [Hyphomicrobiales bacterium]
MPMALKFFIAFAVVLGLIGLTAWLVRRFAGNRLGNAAARGRQPRLAVIDAATVDARRRLVLIRRDNIEHLLMIGGPTDLVVEPNIVRAVGSREVTREPARVEPSVGRPAPVVESPRPVESAWPLQPLSEPVQVPPPRPYRSTATEEPWHAPEPGARPRPADSLTGLAAELSTRLNPPELPAPPPPRHEPAPRASAALTVPAEPAAPAQNDHNLAEMAQQLEAALRRAPVSEPPAVPPPAASPRPEPLARAPMREFKPRAEPKLEVKFEPKIEPKPEAKFEPKFEPKLEPIAETKFEPKLEPKFEAKFEPKIEPKIEPKPEPKPEPAQNLYDNLEQEMASLLGRPSGKS